jgi:hypothetical protein
MDPKEMNKIGEKIEEKKTARSIESITVPILPIQTEINRKRKANVRQ